MTFLLEAEFNLYVRKILLCFIQHNAKAGEKKKRKY